MRASLEIVLGDGALALARSLRCSSLFRGFGGGECAAALVPTPLIPPRSLLDLPISHHFKIHSADQLGPVCLGGFHVGHSLLQSARV